MRGVGEAGRINRKPLRAPAAPALAKLPGVTVTVDALHADPRSFLRCVHGQPMPIGRPDSFCRRKGPRTGRRASAPAHALVGAPLRLRPHWLACLCACAECRTAGGAETRGARGRAEMRGRAGGLEAGLQSSWKPQHICEIVAQTLGLIALNCVPGKLVKYRFPGSTLRFPPRIFNTHPRQF